MATIYYVKDADLHLLDNKVIGIIGYGSQGHAHAQNLKESGCKVVVAEAEGSAGWLAAKEAGFEVLAAEGLAEGRMFAREHRPEFAVLDMRLAEGSGLDLLKTLRDLRPEIRIVIVTGYGNIATAVAAIKAGAADYLAKPVDADDVVAALLRTGQGLPPPRDNPMSADRVRWEHIQRVFEQCNRNVSETARRLNMHRRTLQRILNKRAPRE